MSEENPKVTIDGKEYFGSPAGSEATEACHA